MSSARTRRVRLARSPTVNTGGSYAGSRPTPLVPLPARASRHLDDRILRARRRHGARARARAERDHREHPRPAGIRRAGCRAGELEPHDPFLLGDMEVACERIRAAIHSGTRICVHGDYDVDGICATALTVLTL